MLLPALSKARAKARAISCTNNLKQSMLAQLMYADDNDCMMPVMDENAAKRNKYSHWPEFLVGNGYISSIRDNALRCPLRQPGADPVRYYETNVSYGMNWWYPGRREGNAASLLERYIDQRKLKAPSTFLTMADTLMGPNKGNWTNLHQMSIWQANATLANQGIHFRHSEKMNGAMGDGHVESLTPSGLNDIQHQPDAMYKNTAIYGYADVITYAYSEHVIRIQIYKD